MFDDVLMMEVAGLVHRDAGCVFVWSCGADAELYKHHTTSHQNSMLLSHFTIDIIGKRLIEIN